MTELKLSKEIANIFKDQREIALNKFEEAVQSGNPNDYGIAHKEYYRLNVFLTTFINENPYFKNKGLSKLEERVKEPEIDKSIVHVRIGLPSTYILEKEIKLMKGAEKLKSTIEGVRRTKKNLKKVFYPRCRYNPELNYKRIKYYAEILTKVGETKTLIDFLKKNI